MVQKDNKCAKILNLSVLKMTRQSLGRAQDTQSSWASCLMHLPSFWQILKTFYVCHEDDLYASHLWLTHWESMDFEITLQGHLKSTITLLILDLPETTWKLIYTIRGQKFQVWYKEEGQTDRTSGWILLWLGHQFCFI